MSYKSKKIKSYLITHKFIPRPGWKKDYDTAIEIFLRILSIDKAITTPNNSSNLSHNQLTNNSPANKKVLQG